MYTVLIVEDDERIRRSYNRVLRSTGWDIVTVQSPLEAQQYVKQVDAVLSDWDMPNGGGARVIELFGANKVVICSGRDGLDVPCTVLVKPAETAQIVEALAKIILE